MRKKANGKPSFEAITTMYVEVSNGKANLPNILENIHKHWGDEYTLVTNDGIELEDSPVTRGKGVGLHSPPPHEMTTLYGCIHSLDWTAGLDYWTGL